MPRIVLVTGGSRGIGRAVAARFAAGGDEVIITGRNKETLAAAADDIGPARSPATGPRRAMSRRSPTRSARRWTSS